MGMHFTAEKHGPVIIAGAAGFALGVAVHAVFATPAKPHAAATPLKSMPAPPASEAGTAESVPNTPRVTTDDGTGDVDALKMALVVQLDPEQESLPRGRTSVLVAHAVLQQYKKLYRRRDPERGRWEKDGNVSEVYEASEDELQACRSSAKAEAIPTFLVRDPRSQKAVLCIGPAACTRIASLVGDMHEIP